MDDDLREPQQAGEGVRISGAQEASPAAARASRSPEVGGGRSAQPAASWDDEDDEPWDEEWPDDGSGAPGARALGEGVDDEDSWPEETDPSVQIRPTRSPQPSASSREETTDEGERMIPIDDDDSPDDGRSSWSTFAGQGPRWRSNADDWNDGDADGDAALTHDDDTRVGALDPDRSEESDLYTFDDLPAKPAAPVAGDKVAARAGGKRPSSARRKSDAGDGQPGPTDRPATRGSRSGPRPPAGPGAKSGPGSRPGPRAPGPRPGGVAGNGGREAPPTSMGARVGTGIVLLGVATLVLIVLKRPGGVILITLALTLAVLELFTALRQRGFQPAIIPAAAGVALMPFVAYNRGTNGLLIALILTTLTCLLWYLVGVVRDRPAVNMAVSLLGVLYVGVLGATGGLILQHPKGVTILLGAIVGTVAYDVFGYFVGSNMGKVPLAPEISPNKTVEGLVFGMIGAVVVCTILFGQFEPFNITRAALLGLVVAVMAPLGDLCESMIKRDLGIKDMGTVLPGHGGVLDRIDAMIFVMPAVYFLALKVL